VNTLINQLAKYALTHGLLAKDDYEYAINGMLYLLKLDTFVKEDIREDVDYFIVMETLLDQAVAKGLIEDTISSRDNFEAKLVDCLIPRPAEVNRIFREKYHIGPRTATDWFYRFSCDTNYIKTRRIAKNVSYEYAGKYGKLQITVNLSKPENDPKDIVVKAQNTDDEKYPKCALCVENVGFYGTDELAPRSNHRTISMTINNEKDMWAFQYSPYAYFNEHCIVLRKDHFPMKVDRDTFAELIDFINKFPNYLIGSNAGLPIVGGSILSHYHFQGGRYDFPIEKARILRTFKSGRIRAEVLDWPLSVIRLVCNNENRLEDMANQIFEAWKQYTDGDLGILAQTEDGCHNTVTPIIKLDGAEYNLYLVLRNNRRTEKRPYGVFHTREEYFHIKKENIGLIEVMGLAILPGRLLSELALAKACIRENREFSDYPELEKHLSWLESIRGEATATDNLDRFFEKEVGRIFESAIEDCGVFKAQDTEAFFRFVEKAIY